MSTSKIFPFNFLLCIDRGRSWTQEFLNQPIFIRVSAEEGCEFLNGLKRQWHLVMTMTVPNLQNDENLSRTTNSPQGKMDIRDSESQWPSAGRKSCTPHRRQPWAGNLPHPCLRRVSRVQHIFWELWWPRKAQFSFRERRLDKNKWTFSSLTKIEESHFAFFPFLILPFFSFPTPHSCLHAPAKSKHPSLRYFTSTLLQRVQINLPVTLSTGCKTFLLAFFQFFGKPNTAPRSCFAFSAHFVNWFFKRSAMTGLVWSTSATELVALVRSVVWIMLITGRSRKAESEGR